MPKKPRQAHIPRQQPTRRRTGRNSAAEAPVPAEPVSAEEAVVVAAPEASAPVAARPRRRQELIQRGRDEVAPRILAGQLPTYERAYLVRELRSIGLISTSLLGAIILLTILLR